MLNRFHLIPACDRQTDGQNAISISRVGVLTRDKHEMSYLSIFLNYQRNVVCRTQKVH